MAVVNHTTSLTPGSDAGGSLNDKCLVQSGDVMNISFSCSVTHQVNGDATVATIPTSLTSSISNIFISAYKEAPSKDGAGVRITSSGNVILNNAVVGASYWIGGCYILLP